MKKFWVLLFLGVMVFGFSGIAMADQTATSTVTVNVSAMDSLTVSPTATINLNTVAGANLTGTPDSSGSLSYTHNYTVPKEITAEVNATTGMPGGGAGTITLTAQLGAGSTVTLVNSGVANGEQTLRTNIAAGAFTNAITYGAQCTIAGTPAGAYQFTVTFTSTDA